MQRRYQIVENRIVETQDAPCQIEVFVNPDNGERRLLVDEYRIDEHTLQSALDPDELARLEFEPGHIPIIFKRPKSYSREDEFLFKVASIGAFVFPDRLVVVLSEEAPLFDHLKVPAGASPRSLMLKMLSRSIFHFREHLKVVSMISDDLQTKINESMENRHLINLFALQKSLVYYLDSISSNGALIDRIRHNAAKIGLAGEEIEAIDDISIENSQCMKQAEIFSNILSSLMDARASIVSNNINVLMKKLNVLTIGIMVPTFVVSAFSMNVRIPLSGLTHAFYAIMGLSFLSVVFFMIFWRRSGW